MPDQIIMAEVCERYGWTLDQYLAQPAWFLDVIRGKMNVEAEFDRRQRDDAAKKH